jgi:hypothetical protein
MNIKNNLKRLWLVAGSAALVLLVFHWFGFDSKGLETTIFTLNIIAFVLSLPCSLFVVPVLAAANYYLAMNPVSGGGLYLNTILLFVVGVMHWFWIVKFWSPAEPQMQKLDLIER